MAQRNSYAYSQRRCADKNSSICPQQDRQNNGKTQKKSLEDIPQHTDIVFECGMRDYMWKNKVKAAELDKTDFDKRKGRAFLENPHDLWDNAPTVERKLRQEDYRCDSPPADTFITWCPEEPSFEAVLRAETKECVPSPCQPCQPQPKPKKKAGHPDRAPIHWALSDLEIETPTRDTYTWNYEERFDLNPLHHLNSLNLNGIPDDDDLDHEHPTVPTPTRRPPTLCQKQEPRLRDCLYVPDEPDMNHNY